MENGVKNIEILELKIYCTTELDVLMNQTYIQVVAFFFSFVIFSRQMTDLVVE